MAGHLKIWEDIMPDCVSDASIGTFKPLIIIETNMPIFILIIYFILYTNYNFLLFQKIRNLYPNPANQAYVCHKWL